MISAGKAPSDKPTSTSSDKPTSTSTYIEWTPVSQQLPAFEYAEFRRIKSKMILLLVTGPHGRGIRIGWAQKHRSLAKIEWCVKDNDYDHQITLVQVSHWAPLQNLP